MNVEDAKTILAKYEDDLTFEDAGEVIIVKTKGYIPKHKWGAIDAEIKELGGKYVGGIGKESHWKVPKTETPQPSQQTSSQTSIEHRWANALEVAVGEIERIIADLRRVKS